MVENTQSVKPTVTVEVTWKSTHTVEVPDGVDSQHFVHLLNNGDEGALDAMGEITSATCSLYDWEASI